MKICRGDNRKKGHDDSGLLLCIISKNDRGNNNGDEEYYMDYVKEHFIPVCCVYTYSLGTLS